MRYIYAYYLYIIALLILQACNNDIFINEDETPSNISVSVEGDYGEAMVPLHTKNLKSLHFDGLETSSNLVYYDSGGNEISKDSPFNMISRIIYESKWCNYEISVGKDGLRIKTYGNSSGYPWNIAIRLEYTYTVSFINIQIECGKDAEIVGITYEEEIHQKGVSYDAHYPTYINKNDNEWTVWIGAMYISYKVDPEYDWANYRNVTMRLPEYHGSCWMYGPERDIRLEASESLLMDNPPERVPVVIAPGTTVRIKNIVTYQDAYAEGVVTFRNPVTKEDYPCRYRTTVSVPVANNVSVDEQR